MKRIVGKYLFVMGLAASTLLAAGGCGKKEPIVEEEVIRPVKVITVGAADEGLKRTFSGTVRAGQEASLAFRVSGKVEEILVSVGEKVEKGRVLARLDQHDYELAVRNIESTLASARAAYKNSESSYQRNKRLYENSNISKAELDQNEAQRNSDRAQVEALEAQLEQARNQLAYTRLEAPFSGFISAKKIEEFENVSAGQAVFALVDPGKLKADVGIPESLIFRVSEGGSVTVALESLPGREFSGTVSEVGVALDASTGTYPVTVVMSDPSPEILPGMTAEVTFTFGFTGSKGFIVPTSAILEDIQTGNRYLWVVADDGTVGKRGVQTGALVVDGLEIISGIEEGEVVVTAGVHQIEEGQKVKVLE
ncbi:MAG: efflux RND transporter periplasmic adaptor subunit [PVC group bacterium]